MFGLTRVVSFCYYKNSMDEKENLQEIDAQIEMADGKKQSFFSRLKWKRRRKKAEKIEKLQKEQLSEEETKIIEEKLNEANREVSKSQEVTKKKKIRKSIFFVFNILLVAGILVWNILAMDDDGLVATALLGIKFKYFLVVIGLLVAIVAIETASTHRMIYRKTFRSRWALAYKSTAICRHYDSVTPLSSGGQSFMATYLRNRDVPTATAISIPFSQLLFRNMTWLFTTTVCMVIAFAKGMTTLISTFSIIGFIIALLFVGLILTFSYSKKAAGKAVSMIVAMLAKLKFVKDFKRTYVKIMRLMGDYQLAMNEYRKAKFDLLLQFALHVAKIVALYSIPYFIHLTLPAVKTGTYGDFFVYTAMIDLASSFIPLPGGTGLNEITFAAIFGPFLGGSTFWGLLLWRSCSYYFYLVQGISVISYDTLYGNRKYNWVRRRIELQKESQEFRRVQIENFRKERNKRRIAQKKAK